MKNLTRPTIDSLGDCLLVGTLEVIYQHLIQARLIPPVKVRYLAAFLYAGYLILAKVKKGKSYQAMYFMPLRGLQISEECSGGTCTLSFVISFFSGDMKNQLFFRLFLKRSYRILST